MLRPSLFCSSIPREILYKSNTSMQTAAIANKTKEWKRFSESRKNGTHWIKKAEKLFLLTLHFFTELGKKKCAADS